MQDNIIKKIIDVVNKKFDLNKEIWEKTFPWKNIEKWLQGETYLNSIVEEVDEVRKELKVDNSIFLEDELWDILWTYMNMLHCFEKEWYINQKKVFERCLQKYSERTDWMNNWISWEKIKMNQKEKLKKEHTEKYGK